MSDVEQSIMLQIQDIAAVKWSFNDSLEDNRQPDTLWWLVDHSQNIAYENAVKGSNILAVDQSVDSVNIGSLYSNWFSLQNAYFATNPFQSQGVTGVQTLQQAIAVVYRWRVPQYFNDTALSGGGQPVSPQYVFPYQDMNLGTYAVTGATTGTFTKGLGPVNSAVAGPGILSVASGGTAPVTAATTLSLTAIYPDGTTMAMTANLPSGSPLGTSVPVGGQQLTGPYTAATDAGVVNVTSAANFSVGTTQPNLVVIVEDITSTQTGPTPLLPLWSTEVAEIVSKTGNQLTLRQPTPPGQATPFTAGLRNNYSVNAMVYPLFNDVNAVSNTTGNAGDKALISFFPDWTQGFVDISGIVVPQTFGAQEEPVGDQGGQASQEGQSRSAGEKKAPPVSDKATRPATPQPGDVLKEGSRAAKP